MGFVFGIFELDLARRELRHRGAVRPLEPRAFTVLAFLLTHRDRAIPKAELLEELAAALQRHAPAGTILVSEAVQQQAAGFFRFMALGSQALPEADMPVPVYSCTGTRRVPSRLAGMLASRTSSPPCMV